MATGRGGRWTRRVVQVGAGHAHLEVIRGSRAFDSRDYELILVFPGPFWDSGLATGMLGGAYPPEHEYLLDRRPAGSRRR